jgi:hypothetical protein
MKLSEEPDYNSDPIAPELLRIARSSSGYANTELTEWTPSYTSLVNAFKSTQIGTKDGSYFVRASWTAPKHRNAL